MAHVPKLVAWPLMLAMVPAALADDGEILQRLRAQEYEISVHDGVYQAPNREQGFRTKFLDSGIVVVPRAPVEAPWEWGLRWTAYGRGEEMEPVSDPVLAVKGNRVEYVRSGLLEWYENSPSGLKQSFRMGAPPSGEREDVHLDLALTGDLSPSISEDGSAVDFVRGGIRLLRYDGLRVTDARDRVLPARMVGLVRGIRIVIDDSDAVYPITIDPLATSPAWSKESNQIQAFFGWSVATAGDVNGDGFSDLIVGAPGFDAGAVDEGRVFVYLGSPSGPGATEAWFADGGQASSDFGKSVATAGDVNGDGYADVIVGAPAADAAQVDEGRAYVFLGSASGLSATPAWTVSGGQASSNFGLSVAGAGDVNGDGYSDAVVGAHTFDAGQTDEGRAFLYLGSASGLSTTPAWSAEGDQASAFFGYSVAGAGDVDGDGYADVVVGAYGFDNGQTNEGRAFLFRGSASGLQAVASWVAESNVASAQFGISVATAGDVNGDGYADVIVGGNTYTNGQAQEGRAWVYHGSIAGLEAAHAWSVESNASTAQFGVSVGTAGDVDGDGYADVIVGASEYDTTTPTFLGDIGRAYVYRGSPTGLDTNPIWVVSPAIENAKYGYSVATAGDMNGDGYADVVVGALFLSNGQYREGRAYAYSGGPSGLATAAGWTSVGSQLGGQFGNAAVSAGDVNGDGYGDVVVGEGGYDSGGSNVGRAHVFLGSESGLATTPIWTITGTQANARLGEIVNGAGDVNGDGYDDILVSAPWYDNANTDAGRVELYLGSPTGPASTPAWYAEGSQAVGLSGLQATGVGDVNGDGYADVAVGAYLESGDLSKEGRVSVYHGSSAGLSFAAAWIRQGNQTNAWFGYSVNGAGDVNGDGFSDLIVGAAGYTNDQVAEGRAYVFLGGAGGLQFNPVWTADGDQIHGEWGRSVASAGDVNGDGYADVLVGSPVYDTSEVDSGAARLYLGFAGGVSATPAWSAFGLSRPEGYFGQAVTGAGDVNGDGLADIAVSEPGYGAIRAMVHLGSPSGPGPTADWTASGSFGFAQWIGPAGDVNGDGFADFLVYSFDLEGQLWLYYGGGSRGVGPAARQRASNNSRPVSLLGVSDSPSAIRFSARARTAFGRGRAALQSEVKPLGQPFDGTGTVQGHAVGTGATANAVHGGLSGRTPYHWRARLVLDPVTSPLAGPRGRWMTIPRGGWTETRFRTPAPPAGRASDLRVQKAGLGVTVTYQKSCLSTDTLHAVYEGTLGDFTSHVPVTCASVGSSWNFTPQPGNRYFLVVPQNGDFEGSHGLQGNGQERPRGAASCLPQNIGACP